MRRLLYWYLPIGVSLVATGVFAAGFYSFLRGDLGTSVNVAPMSVAAAQPAQRSVIAPVIVGDSVARGTGDENGLGIGGRLAEELKRRNIRHKQPVNLAVNGARTTNLLQQLESPNMRTVLAEGNVIIVSIGGNDLWGGGDWRSQAPPNPDAIMGDVLDRIHQIMQTLRNANPTARIFLVGLYNPFASTQWGAQLTPLVNRWNGKLLDRFGADANVTIVPVADLFSHHDRLSVDRFHPGGEGYGLIAKRIAESL